MAGYYSGPFGIFANLQFCPLDTTPEVLGYLTGLAFDVAVHVGSLMAVMIYFRRDIVSLTQAWLDSVFVRRHSYGESIGWYIILGTVPAGLTGLIR